LSLLVKLPFLLANYPVLKLHLVSDLRNFDPIHLNSILTFLTLSVLVLVQLRPKLFNLAQPYLTIRLQTQLLYRYQSQTHLTALLLLALLKTSRRLWVPGQRCLI